MIHSLHLNKRLLGFPKLPKTFKSVEVRPNDVIFRAAAPRTDRESAEEHAEEPVAAVTVNAALEDAAAALRVPETAVPEVYPRQGPDRRRGKRLRPVFRSG